jgi:hypothetical protein
MHAISLTRRRAAAALGLTLLLAGGAGRPGPVRGAPAAAPRLDEQIRGPWEGGGNVYKGVTQPALKIVFEDDGTFQWTVRAGRRAGQVTLTLAGIFSVLPGDQLVLREPFVSRDPGLRTRPPAVKRYKASVAGNELTLSDGKGKPQRYRRPPGWAPPVALDPAESEKRAAAALAKLGVSLNTGLRKPGDPVTELMLFNEHVNPAVLKALGGLVNLRTLLLSRGTLTNESLKDLRRLKKLDKLTLMDVKGLTGDCLFWLQGTGMRDLWVEGVPLGPMQVMLLWGVPLRDLALTRCNLTEDCLIRIKMMRRLEGLYVGWTNLGDSSMKPLGTMTRLKRLGVNETGITDEGVRQLKDLKDLEWLRLDDNKVTDACLETVKGFPNLQVLFLNNTTGFSDKGMKEVARIKSLRELRLSTWELSRITDAGIRELRALPNLETLSLGTGSRISEEAADELRKALPKLRIEPRRN